MKRLYVCVTDLTSFHSGSRIAKIAHCFEMNLKPFWRGHYPIVQSCQRFARPCKEKGKVLVIVDVYGLKRLSLLFGSRVL